MMIYDVTLTDQAEADLRGIFEYIAFELLSPFNAERQLDRLEKNVKVIRVMYSGRDINKQLSNNTNEI